MEPSLGVMLALAVVLFCVCIVVLYCTSGNKQNNSSYHHVTAAPQHYDLHCEVVVVGSGILGSAIAAVLSQDGRKVIAVERDVSEPDRIVGELLQPGGYAALTKLGLKDAAEGIDSHVVHGYVIHDYQSRSNITLGYPLDKNCLTKTGRSFHHGRFVMGLRDQAKKSGATLVEGTVNSLLTDETGSIVGVRYKDKQADCSQAIKADLTIVADGCFSKFRKDLSSLSVTVSSHFVGLLMHDCPQHKAGHAEIILTPKGPVLVYQISSVATRILIDIHGKMPSNTSQYLKDEILPYLTAGVKKPFEEALKNDRIRSMPNSFLPPSNYTKPGVLLLGDAFNMRHPLTGAGMTVALNDVLIWRELLQSVPDLKDYASITSQQKKFLSKRKQSHSFTVNVLAQALYSLFSASDRDLFDLRQACFEYFKFGGRTVTDTVGLLSVLRPNPFILIGHFFLVALYAVFRTVSSSSLWRLHYGIYRSANIFIKACKVIFPLIRSEF